jgi:hypothetical protein
MASSVWNSWLCALLIAAEERTALLLVIANAPKDLAARTRAAQLAGLPPADFSRRLAGTLPRVLLAAAPADQVGVLVDGFESLGFAAFACDPTTAPGDEDRLLVRSIDVKPDALAFLDGKGEAHPCLGTAVSLIQRGLRVITTSETVNTTERRLDIGKAVLSGGLLLTSKIQKQSVRTEETREAFLLLQRNDGQPDAIIYERRVDYRFLGAAKQPASYANLELTLARLRVLAPAAPLDDRVAKPGFVSGLPLTSSDPVDLALYLVTLARTRGF